MLAVAALKKNDGEFRNHPCPIPMLMRPTVLLRTCGTEDAVRVNDKGGGNPALTVEEPP